MILKTATRFDEKNWFKTEIDKSVPNCEVTGELDGVPVSFFGDVEEDLIIGGNVAWNQGIKDDCSSGSVTWSESITNYNVYVYQANVALIKYYSSHKYLISAKIERTLSDNDAISLTCLGGVNVGLANGEANGIKSKVLAPDVDSDGYVGIAFNNYTGKKGFASGDSASYSDFMLIDLTQMFGSTIADYIYSLEQANEGAGVSLFKTLFAPGDYYRYDAGTEKTITLR